MPRLKEIRTSLEVGFPEGGPPASLLHLRGHETRAIGKQREFPFEDAQFDVVMLDGGAVDCAMVREAHRVLKPEGWLCFIVPERTKKQEGFTLPGIYSIVRDGFNIIEVNRPAWWLFGRRGHTISICALKKTWKTLNNAYRPYL